MDYDALEVELVGVLNTYFGANNLSSGPDVLLNTVFSARQMPEDQTELLETYDKGMVNVQYSDSTFNDPPSVDLIRQDETVKIACYLVCNKLKGASGGYKLIDCVKKALIGYKPTDARTRMWLSDFAASRIDEGSWHVDLEFTFKTICQEVIQEGPEYPIDSVNSVNISGPLVEVDSSLYELPDTEHPIGEDDQVIPPLP